MDSTLGPYADRDCGRRSREQRFPDGPPANLIEGLKAERVFVSQRTDSLRISPHLYNNQEDIDRLFEALAKLS